MRTDTTTDEGYRLTTENISGTIAAYLYLPNHPSQQDASLGAFGWPGLCPTTKDLISSSTLMPQEPLSALKF